MFTQNQLLEHFQTHQLSYKLYQHAAVATVEQDLQAIAELNIPGVVIKNLFLKDDHKNFYLVSAVHTTKIDLKTLGKVIGAKKLRFADPTLLKTHLGVEPGSVTPLALINDPEHTVKFVLDSNALQQDYIQVHPLRNDATVAITPTDLLQFLKLMDRKYHVYNFTHNELE